MPPYRTLSIFKSGGFGNRDTPWPTEFCPAKAIQPGVCETGLAALPPVVEPCLSRVADHPEPLPIPRETRDAENCQHNDVEPASTWRPDAGLLKTERRTETEVLRNIGAAAAHGAVNKWPAK